MASFSVRERASHIKALVLDVDGILSDGFLSFTNSGEEIKSFDIRDGLGMKLVQRAGIKVAVITGRSSNIVNNRMQSLGVDLVIQGREDKGIALREVCQTLQILPEECAYMGDDWPDLAAMQIAGLAITVPNAHEEVRKRANLITQACGGRGAVREFCDVLLQAKGVYNELLEEFLQHH
jgi:3-deoxy-D-manno-octulosonate 8-phosphate phosphatase (KDO 8-P phosphatase)